MLLEVGFYTKLPNKAPLFNSPFLKNVCGINQQGGKPPNSPAESIPRAIELVIDGLIKENIFYIN